MASSDSMDWVWGIPELLVEQGGLMLLYPSGAQRVRQLSHWTDWLTWCGIIVSKECVVVRCGDNLKQPVNTEFKSQLWLPNGFKAYKCFFLAKPYTLLWANRKIVCTEPKLPDHSGSQKVVPGKPFFQSGCTSFAKIRDCESSMWII